jgi:hypothetical protein
MQCSCGSFTASFNFRDEIFPTEVVNRIYCPQCSSGVTYDDVTMLKDNGWLIEYDMDIARFMGHRLPGAVITPEYLFDEGYCTWRGMYPTDLADSLREREELVRLSRVNPRKYLEEIKKWSIDRMDRLNREGWRKAHAGR